VRGIEGSEAEVVLTGAEAARRQGMGNGKTLDAFMAGMVLRGSKARARASEMEGERGEEELRRPLLRLGHAAAAIGHGGGATRAWLPRRQIREHMVCAAVPVLEAEFGMALIESRNGLKSKVVPLLMLYIFH
jgi:hypothetical protein